MSKKVAGMRQAILILRHQEKNVIYFYASRLHSRPVIQKLSLVFFPE
jgi:hypothetical protein